VNDKLPINIKIGERIYKILINRGDTEREELLRRAANEINKSINDLKIKGFKNKDTQDFLAMTVIKFAVQALESEDKEDVTPLLNELKVLNYDLEDAIEKNNVL
jgi:hypothetical protein